MIILIRGELNFLGVWIVYLLVFAAHSKGESNSTHNETLKCYFCASRDYLPAWAEDKLIHTADFNNSYSHSHMDLDFLAQDCDTKTVHNSCKNGTFCAKRTVTYVLETDDDGNHTYTSFMKMCTLTRLDGESGVPTNGECKIEASASTDTGISRNVTWCYCNDEDYCNGKSVPCSLNILLFAVVCFTVIYGCIYI
ncbi:hypothetical protein DdX_12335 [Ditylenchus destructor]|uniref:Uncharacterized protein n=1 Tax=Ditylenchus destructor TaxID=166010 RepID=A0AAD4N150_9BILA|nr:hypothetical protein DdX_12335 [Ditylenchus destructor]